MLDYIKKTMRSSWLQTVAFFALLVAVVVYAWRRVDSARARSVVAVQRAKIEVDLFKARKRAKTRKKGAVGTAELEHREKALKLDTRAREIKTAADDSSAALAAAINRSFRK